MTISEPNAVRTIVGTALYLTILGLLAIGIGTLLRKTAGGICAIVGMVFVLPVLAGFLPSSLDSIQKFLPSNAGQAILYVGEEGDGPRPSCHRGSEWASSRSTPPWPWWPPARSCNAATPRDRKQGRNPAPNLVACRANA